MNSPKHIEAQMICRGLWAPGVTRSSTTSWHSLSSRVGTTPPADATCAGDQVQPFLPVVRAFSLLSTFRQKPLQHPANVSAHLPIARALALLLAVLAVAHPSSPRSMHRTIARA